MKRILFGVLAFVALWASVALADVQQATGEGPSREQALASALRSAVEQGVGTFITSTSMVVDSQLVDDKILSHSKGYVTGYRILKEGRTVGGYAVTISATVDVQVIKEDIDALTILRKVAGNPRILIAFNQKGEGAQTLMNKTFVDEINSGIEEALTDKQFRVVAHHRDVFVEAVVVAGVVNGRPVGGGQGVSHIPRELRIDVTFFRRPP